MTIPIYEAISFNQVLSKGGTTKPWLIEVLVEESPQPYVVKVFRTETLKQYPAVSNEVFANVLAIELDLSVPNSAFIHFSKEFIKGLSDEQKILVENQIIDHRIKFATEYIKNSTIFSPVLHNNFLYKYDVASIYAFDNLIHNVDRRKEKPNILFQNEFYYLIDHELSISESITQGYLTSIKSGNWKYLYNNHVFYEYLKKEEKKENIFDHLVEILRRIDVNCLDEVNRQLTEHEHYVNHLDIFKKYLRYIKANPQLFIHELKRQIR